MNENSERRQIPRVPVSWEARCVMGATALQGRLRDVTDTGAFMETGGRPSDVPGTEVAGPQPDGIVRGDKVELVYQISPDWQTEKVVASVRWQGWSDRHDCHGLGLRFEPH